MKRLFILLLIVSCQGNADKTAEESDHIVEDPIQTSLDAYCFYKMDDKYCEVEDQAMLKNWMENKSIALSHHDVRGNLFDRTGGGPSGAEWNPSTAIYLVYTVDPSTVEVSVNNQPLENESDLVAGYTWVKIPANQWERLLAPISAADWDEMFPDGVQQEEDYSGVTGGISPPRIGQIIKFNFQSSSTHKTYFFHAAFGE